ncbi:hypothetical protein H8D91_01290 [archaeon]|nr:hypothetical protein [archaeon]
MKENKTSFVSILREAYKCQGFTHVNLARYEPCSDSFGDLGKNLSPEIIPLDSFTEKFVRSLTTNDYVVGINSNARLENGFQAYLPQLDLDWNNSDLESLDKTIEEIVELFPEKQTVHIADSGQGYHFYGTKKMSFKNWKKFMWDSKNSPVDQDFIERSLDIGYSTLRLTSGKGKPQSPFFIGRTLV